MKLIAILLTLLLCGCSSMHVRVKATSDVNRDEHDAPQSVAIHVFQLKGIAAFNSAHLIPLFDNPGEVLGNDLLSDRELFVQPGRDKYFSETLLPGAEYIGVVAAFRRHHDIPWRHFVMIRAANHYANERVHIELSSAGLSVE